MGLGSEFEAKTANVHKILRRDGGWTNTEKKITQMDLTTLRVFVMY